MENESKITYSATSELDYFRHKEELEKGLDKIVNALKDKVGFEKCTISLGHPNQINISHERIKAYYLYVVSFDYDFYDFEEKVDLVIESWDKAAEPNSIDSYISFLEEGQKYGWD